MKPAMSEAVAIGGSLSSSIANATTFASLNAAATSVFPPGGKGRLQLRLKPSLKASEFESKWASLGHVEMMGATLKAPLGTGELERVLAASGIACMASGAVAGVAKYYFYAQEEPSGKLAMAEVSVTAASLRLSAVIKASEPGIAAEIAEVFTAAMKGMAMG
jgi:hypothetical protein